MHVELGDVSMESMIGVGFISFFMPSSDVLEIHYVLLVPRLTKNIVLVFFLIDIKCVVEFDDQQVIIKKCNLDPG
jgi:hypothetical protein